MKKANKIIWIIAGALCAVGLIVMVMSYVLMYADYSRKYPEGDDNFQNVINGNNSENSTRYEDVVNGNNSENSTRDENAINRNNPENSTKEQTVGGKYIKETQKYDVAGIKKITTDLSNRSVNIIEANTDKIVVTYFNQVDGDNYGKVSCENSNGTILVESSEKNLFDPTNWVNFGINMMDIEVTIEIPQSFSGDLDLRSSNGGIKGGLKIENLNIGEVKIKTSNGGIEIENLKCVSANFTSSNGGINLDNLLVTGDLDAKTSNGRIVLADTKAANIHTDSSNGKIEIDKTTSSDILQATTSNSAIYVTSIDGKDIRLKTNNGKITGDIIGNQADFTIDSSTSNGDNSLPETQQGDKDKKLFAKTNNASIDLEFVR